ncbi:MAG: hypothetical protein AAFX50_12260, partial [Acidobacteriota bacterium]
MSHAASTYGDLLVTNGRTDTGGSRRDDFVASLPTLGGAAVTGWSAAGADAWITADRTLHPRWLGAWVELRDGGGAVLGTYEVIELDGGQALLEGAASAGPAAQMRGLYRFDSAHIDDVEFKLDDPFVVPDLTLDGRAQLGSVPVVENLHLLPGTYLRPESGDTLEIEVLDTLTIDAGVTLDVSGLGYAGSSSADTPAGAPEWVAGSLSHTGGSHGGGGSVQSGGPAGEVYDSVYRPRLSGGGGTKGEQTGSTGGGVIRLEAQTLVLDGDLRADAVDLAGGSSGAGGTVSIEAAVLSGSGSVSAAGGDADRGGQLPFYFGNGGGGRVEYRVADLSGWDVRAQTDVRAGRDLHVSDRAPYGAAGTVFVRDAASTYGELILDLERRDDGGESGRSATALPVLGGGAVTAAEASGGDAWLTAAFDDGGAIFRPRWLGAYVELFDGSGGSLGTFEVDEIDAAGRARALGAATVAGSAADFEGRYLFDHISMRDGSSLSAEDPVTAGTMELSGRAALAGPIVAQDAVVRAGALLTPVAGLDAIRFRVAGTLTIEAGAVVDVSGAGYPGGANQTPGAQPAWTQAGTRGTGGSHGGGGAPMWGGGPAG